MEEEEQISTEKQNSVSFETSTKGVWSFKCKAYADTAEKAFEEATRISELAEQVCKAKNIGKI